MNSFSKKIIKSLYPEPVVFLAAAVKYAVNLLFSKPSLTAIHRLFIDESDVINRDEIDPDDLYEAFTYLKDQLKFNDISKSVVFDYTEKSFVKDG